MCARYIDAGELDQRITIYKRLGNSNSGFSPDDYAPLATTWASVRAESVKEFLDAEAMEVAHTVSMRIRWRRDVPDDGLVEWDSRYWRIKHADPYKHRRDYLTLLCTFAAKKASAGA